MPFCILLRVWSLAGYLGLLFSLQMYLFLWCVSFITSMVRMKNCEGPHIHHCFPNQLAVTVEWYPGSVNQHL